MRPTLFARCLNALILALTLVLSSCGGGSNTAGAGGSGIGGTGITTVTGNISYVVAPSSQAELAPGGNLLAGVINWLSSPVIAQDAQDVQLGGIQVFGGGRSAITDDAGNFTLEDVAPSDHFVLNFVLEENETVSLPIGVVRAGTRVKVNDIVVNADQGFANAGSVEVEENTTSSEDPDNGSAGTPGGAGNNVSSLASNNSNATGASASSNDNSSETANSASDNNRANNASNGANANPNAEK